MSEFTPRWMLRLLAAQRDLIEACGGIARVMEKTSHSKSQVGRWNGGADRDLMPISAVLILEEDCARPLVTNVMAEFNGRALTDPADCGERIACLSQQVAALVATAGRMVVEAANAKADGVVTPNEAIGLRGTLGDIKRLSSEIEDLLAGVQAGGRA